MISSILSRLVILLFGTLYPAYSSYKAVRTKNVKEYVKWMMYWIVFALFTCAETITDIFLSFWFPFYYEFKIILVVYLLSPATNGSSILYRKFVHPVLTKKEQEIDECIAKAMENGYHTMLNLGSKSVAYATSVIMETAVKRGGALVTQIRKSYSLDDITAAGEPRSMKWSKDEADNGQDEERQKYRRRKAYSPRRTTVSSGSPTDGFYPELDAYKRSSLPLDHDILRNVRSSEDISSGYSSTEQLMNGAKYGSREQLTGANSTGPALKTRSRVAKKDESGCSTTEPDESQYEADEGNPFPFLIRRHSGNFLAPFVKPEYRYLFANLTEQQICNIGGADPPVEQVQVEASPNPSTVLQTILSFPGEGEKETRNGKRKKNQAPLPPSQKPGGDESEEETGFSTPDSSPVLARKEGVPVIVESGNEGGKEQAVEPWAEPLGEPLTEPLAEPMAEPVTEPVTGPVTEGMTESLTESKWEKKGKKGKGKTGESQISKMLHLSKIQIPFWGHKSGKHSPECSSASSMSRNSSHHSLSSRGEQESCASLKDFEEGIKAEPDAIVGVREMSQSPSSKRRSFVD